MKGFSPTQMVGLLAAGWLLAGCVGTAATPAGSGGGPATPSLRAAATPSATPTDKWTRAIEAIRIIDAVGGSAPPLYEAQFSDDCWPALGPCVTIGAWQVVWDSRGDLALVFDQPSANETLPATSLTKAQATAKALAVLDALEVPAGPPDEVTFDQSTWSAVWWCVEDGVPVESDGIFVYLDPDGAFRQYTRVWRTLAPKPDTILTADEALARIDDCQGTSAFPCSQPTLKWYQVTEAPEPLRLCWVVTQGRSWYAVDAGTGEVFEFAVAGI